MRRETVAELWAEDGIEFTSTAEHLGHDALEARIAAAYEQFVAPGTFRFIAADDAVRHHDATTFTTHMVRTTDGLPVWSGVVFALLDQKGRIRQDYQFTGKEADTRAVVAEFLDRLGGGEPERIAELFADTVDWRLDWPDEDHPAVPWIRRRSTRADVADHFRALNTFHDPDKRGGTPPQILVDGADAVLVGVIRQTVKATDTAYTADYALRLTVESGEITRYHVYEDSLAVTQAFEPAT
ncbi:nuclear transport factor 2 family protein [Cryptosporangium sp. NPDC048952]|uniref:nuclear transport factor 2 family protein n=1 Tax=Cryptosporangium sp. NPDC048952 TaxID=3363961 RepID=UPI0037114E92